MRKGYKPTELGPIPDDWELKCLGALGEVLIGLTYRPEDVKKHGILVLRSSNIQNEALAFDDNVYVDAEIPERIMVVPGDVLICVRNGSRELIGKSALLDERARGMTFGAFMAVYRSKIGPLVSYNFQSQILKRQVKEHLGATINQITNKSLKSFRIPVPPTEVEQRAIAEALSDVDALLGALDRLITKKRSLKQAAMQQLLLGRTRLPGFAGKWVELSMAERSILKARIGWQGLTTSEYRANGDHLLVTGTDFVDGRINWQSCWHVSEERYMQDSLIQLRENDILLTKDGSIGKVAFVSCLPKPATLNSGVFVIRPKDESYSSRFFYYILSSSVFDEFLRRLQAGSTISHLYQKDFIDFTCLAPPTVEEQAAIAAVLSDMDTELAALEARRDKTWFLKQGMMQELLTGRTRLA